MSKYANVAENVGKFLQKGDWQTALAKKGSILNSNQAINKFPTGGFRAGGNAGMMSGIPRAVSNVRHGNMGVVDAAKAAHTNADGSYNAMAIAGSYIGASAAYRVASGGGVTRDKDGNSNLIGVPFI